MRSDEIRREIATLEGEMAALRAAERDEHSAIAALESQLTEVRDRLALARRALVSHETQIEERRAALEEALVHEAQERLDQVMQERDVAAAALAEASEQLLERLAALDRSQEAARNAWTTAHAGATGHASDQQMPPELFSEPEVMRESWARLCDEIRNRISEQFDDELVDAASRSPLGNAINDLPLRLREVARQRRQALIRRGQDA